MAGKGIPRGAAQAFLDQATAYEGDDCLLWPYGRRCKNKGYGVVRMTNDDGTYRIDYAHRVVLERTQGPSPDPNMVAAHAPVICHNQTCVNPRHLRWATRRENAADRHLDGTIHTIARDDVEWIRLYESRVKAAAMAHMFGVSVKLIRAIQRGKAYEHITINGKVTVPGQRWKPVDEAEPKPKLTQTWPPPAHTR